jgi:hypothetical protein
MILHVRMPPFLSRASEAWPWLSRANPGCLDSRMHMYAASQQQQVQSSALHSRDAGHTADQAASQWPPSIQTAVLPCRALRELQACLGRKKSRADMQSIAGARR